MDGLGSRAKAGAAVFVGLLVGMVLTVPTVGQQLGIDIALDTVVEDEPGTEHLLADREVPADLVGRTCTATAVARNQESVHPGNDLVVATGDDQVVLANVEGVAFGEVTAEESLQLGETVTVTLVLGEDGVFSAGIEIRIRCPEPAATTVTSVPPEAGETSTTAPQTTTPPDAEATSTTVMGETTSTTLTGDTTSTTPTTEGEGATTSSTVPPTLPFTGPGPASGVAGLAALAMGGILLALTRTRNEPTR